MSAVGRRLGAAAALALSAAAGAALTLRLAGAGPREADAPFCAGTYPDVDGCVAQLAERLRAAVDPAPVLASLAALRAAYPEDWRAAYLQGQGTFWAHEGDAREAARPHFAAAESRARAAADPEGVARSRIQLGALHESVDRDLEAARRSYAEAAEAADASGRADLGFQSAWATATTLNRLGRYAEQLDWLRRAQARLGADRAGGPLARAVLYAEGNAQRKLGNVRIARARFEAVVEQAEAVDDVTSVWDRATGRLMLGVLELDFGDPARAVPLFERAREVARGGDEPAVANDAEILIGVAELQLGAVEAARTRLRDTLDASLRFAEAQDDQTTPAVVNLLFLAEAERRLGDEAAALRLLRSARERTAAWSRPNLEWQASGALAALHLQAGRVDAAVEEGRLAVERIESLRSGLPEAGQRVYFLHQRSNAYAVLASSLAAREGGLPDAFATVQRAHARVLREVLASAADDRDAGHDAGLDADLEAVRAALQPGELLLDYLLGEEESLLIAATRDAAELHRLPPRKEIEAAAGAWTDVLRRPLTAVEARADPRGDLARHRDRGVRLRALLLGPVEPLVREAHRLILVPDKRLHGLPFESLPAAGGSAGFLAGSRAVAYVPAAAFVLRRAPRPRADGAALALVAAPAAHPALDLPALAHAEREVRAIRRAWSGARVELLDGPAATPAALRSLLARPVDALHVVGHAVLHPGTGPRILLAPGSEPLTADDVAGLAPAPPLVVLSACETAEGELVGGEGVLGLVRAFTLAGSRQIVATLWSADDAASATLMGAFHERLRAGEQPVAALASARREMLAGEFVHPFYWAGYAVFGLDGDRGPS